MGWNVLKYNLFRVRTPVNLMLAVTDRCNGSCEYCAVSCRGKADLPAADLCRVIDDFSALGGSRIALWGGEPLVREDIGDIIRHCRSRSLLTSMDTNGYLVPERMDVLRDLDVLVVSFDGYEKAHDAQRGKGSYRKVIRAFEAACSSRLPRA